MLQTPTMKDLFNDSELLAATGLSLVHVRRLITWGAVTPFEGGKGVVRQWEPSEIRHLACVKALFDAGLSLPMAHTILSLLPAYFSIRIVDPRTIMNPRVQAGWFDPKRPLNIIEKSDVILMLIDGFTAFWRLGRSKPFFMGRLTDDRSVVQVALDYSKFNDADPSSLSFRHMPEAVTRAEMREAVKMLAHPISITTVNLGLASRIAMRRLLGIPVYFPGPDKGAR